MSIRLGINIDHVATLRNMRNVEIPSPFEAAKVVENVGADQVTIHLREDRRHIRELDAIKIIKELDIDTNLEIAPTEEMINFTIKNRPNIVCLVPEKRRELTTEGGLNLDLKSVHSAIHILKKENIETCLFIDPSIDNINKCKDLDIKYIELHTGKYANLKDEELNKEIQIIRKCAQLSEKLDIKCHAGHGLNYQNVTNIAKIKEIKELNIGHSIISMSIFYGLEESIKRMINIIKDCRK